MKVGVILLAFLSSTLAIGGQSGGQVTRGLQGNNFGNTGGIVGYNSNYNAINQPSTYDRLDDGYPAPEKLTEIDNFGVGFQIAHRRTKYSPVRYQHHGNANNFNGNAGNTFGNIGRGVSNGLVNRESTVQGNGQQYHLFSNEFKIFGPEVHENAQPSLPTTGHVISTNNIHIGLPVASRPIPSRRKGYPQNPYPGGVIHSRIKVRNINLGAGTGIAAFMSGREGISNSGFDNSNLLIGNSGVGNGNTGYGNNRNNVGIATGSGSGVSGNIGVGANAFAGAGSYGTTGISNNNGGYRNTNTGNGGINGGYRNTNTGNGGINGGYRNTNTGNGGNNGGYRNTNTGNGGINDAAWNGDFGNRGGRNVGFANGGINTGTGNTGFRDIGNRGINTGRVSYRGNAGIVSGAQSKVGTGVVNTITRNNNIPAVPIANVAPVGNAGNVVGYRGNNGIVSGAQSKIGTRVVKPITRNNNNRAVPVANVSPVGNAGNVGSRGYNSYNNKQGNVGTQTLAAH